MSDLARKKYLEDIYQKCPNPVCVEIVDYFEKEIRQREIRAGISGMRLVLVDMQESPAKEHHYKRIAELEKELKDANG